MIYIIIAFIISVKVATEVDIISMKVMTGSVVICMEGAANSAETT